MALKRDPYHVTADINKLTPREDEALKLQRTGLTIQQVADALGIKRNTANSLLAKAQDKVRHERS